MNICILPFQTENGKQKSRRFSKIHLPFAHRANGLNGQNGPNGFAHYVSNNP